MAFHRNIQENAERGRAGVARPPFPPRLRYLLGAPLGLAQSAG